MKGPREPKRPPNGEKPKGILTSRSIKCNRWAFEKPIKNPCITTIIPLDQLSDFVSSEIPATQFSAKSFGVLEFERIEEPKSSNQKSDKSQYELECSGKLAKLVKGVREVSTPAGRIDVLSNECLYELKIAQNWKHALGQLLVYGFYYPNHRLVLVLLGNQTEEYLPLATQHSERFGIEVKVF